MGKKSYFSPKKIFNKKTKKSQKALNLGVLKHRPDLRGLRLSLPVSPPPLASELKHRPDLRGLRLLYILQYKGIYSLLKHRPDLRGLRQPTIGSY